MSYDNGSNEKMGVTSQRFPRLGATVVYHQPPGEKSLGNGAKEHPAIITRVWGPDCVNIKVFPDCGEIVDRTSIPRAFYSGQNWGFQE
jgi:hypothetical protein